MPGFRAEGTREMSALWLGWSVGISSSVSMSVAGRITIWDDVDGRLLAVAQRAPGDTVGHNCSSAVVGGWSVKLWPTGGHSLFTQATATIGRRAEAGTFFQEKRPSIHGTIITACAHRLRSRRLPLVTRDV